ncbi:hypothetical protein NC653_000301 [Populus alba x Populus x berolinensis]|uniref:Uncharacterized protein n=1 Tax=Populus alba x Populus x berolinensis TaxID=444605 RepID=A0AAD6RJA6_9ROSI|nr:hypothetical protein NC653_000301 [Populus alba x Populus x berolinensis]
MGKMQGLWFSMDGLPGEEIGKETGLKGTFGLLWLNGLPSHGFQFAVTLLILRCDSNNDKRCCVFLRARQEITALSTNSSL